MWKVSWLYEKVHNITNFGGYAAILHINPSINVATTENTHCNIKPFDRSCSQKVIRMFGAMVRKQCTGQENTLATS